MQKRVKPPAGGNERKLTCADLFCGAGGFSEGFRQAGFRVTTALDIWVPALLTHAKNHPDTETIRADILTYDPSRLGPVDVLIGSPPCTEFSYANRGGNGDIEYGMRLVYRFLRFVYELQPRWWVMENVPRVLDFLPPEVPLRKLGIDKKGTLPVPVREVLLAADHGAPQMRRRAFSGDFPVPAATHGDLAGPGRRWPTLRDVTETLPDPLGQRPDMVRDPVYEFSLRGSELTDHFALDLVLTREEARENRKAKEDHSWYGRMSFPDELDRPARTVMATNLRVSRETTVIRSINGRYRRLSVREASSVQGFPITYQWWGATGSLKYKQVGNAVVPPIAYAIGRGIVSASEMPMIERPYVIERVAEPAPEPNLRRHHRTLPLTRRFREHVPGSKLPGYRVDLDNQGGPSAKVQRPGATTERGAAPISGTPIVEWRAVLYCGGGKAVRHRTVGIDEALRLLALTVADAAARRRARRFLDSLTSAFAKRVPSATTLQLIRAERQRGDVTPYVLLKEIGDIVARHFESGPRVVRLDARRDPDFVPARIAATLVATAYVCALANEHRRKPALRLPRTARSVLRASAAAAGAELERG